MAGTGAAVGAGGAEGGGGAVVVVVEVVVVVAGRLVVVVVGVVVVGGTAGNCTGSIGDGAAGTVATRARPNMAEATIATSEAITSRAGLRRTARQYGEGGRRIGEWNVRVLSSPLPAWPGDAMAACVAWERNERLDSIAGVLYPLLN